MKTIKLLPHVFKKIGLILFSISLVLTILAFVYSTEPAFFEVNMVKLFEENLFNSNAENRLIYIEKENIYNELCLASVLIGGLFVLFGKEKDEDELLNKLRLESILWSAGINGILLIIANFLLYNFGFFYVLIINLFLLFILFILKFEWSLFKLRKASNEE